MSEPFPWTHFRSTKSAVKMHTMLDLRGSIPSFNHYWRCARCQHARRNRFLARCLICLGPWLSRLLPALPHPVGGAFFVTRAKSNLDASRIYSHRADKQGGILSHQTIALNGYISHKGYPSHLRRIRFRDAQTGKHLVFLTNQFTLPTATTCALYKSRCQVELFFKWVKQHLRIKVFYGTGENAVQTQT